MSNRFQEITGNRAAVYTGGAPLSIGAWALLEDTESGKLLLQARLHSLSEKVIESVLIHADVFDSEGLPLTGPEDHLYEGLSAGPGTDFGTNTAIVVPDPNTRKASLKCLKVRFSDGTEWTAGRSAVWAPLNPYIAAVEAGWGAPSAALERGRKRLRFAGIISAALLLTALLAVLSVFVIAPAVRKNSGRLKCANCGAPVNAGDANCMFCGSPLQPAEESGDRDPSKEDSAGSSVPGTSSKEENGYSETESRDPESYEPGSRETSPSSETHGSETVPDAASEPGSEQGASQPSETTADVTEPAATHQHQYALAEEIPATCTGDGSRRYVCACGSEYTERVAAAGHDWIEATCTEARRCAVCGVTEGEPLGHDEHIGAGYCLRCGRDFRQYRVTWYQSVIIYSPYGMEHFGDYILTKYEGMGEALVLTDWLPDTGAAPAGVQVVSEERDTDGEGDPIVRYTLKLYEYMGRKRTAYLGRTDWISNERLREDDSFVSEEQARWDAAAMSTMGTTRLDGLGTELSLQGSTVMEVEERIVLE